MIEKDTVELLRECDSGVKMGVDAIEEVLPYVHAPALKQSLTACKKEHKRLENEILEQLEVGS